MESSQGSDQQRTLGGNGGAKRPKASWIHLQPRPSRAFMLDRFVVFNGWSDQPAMPMAGDTRRYLGCFHWQTANGRVWYGMGQGRQAVWRARNLRWIGLGRAGSVAARTRMQYDHPSTNIRHTQTEVDTAEMSCWQYMIEARQAAKITASQLGDIGIRYSSGVSDSPGGPPATRGVVEVCGGVVGRSNESDGKLVTADYRMSWRRARRMACA
jgi:hypothetical protein